MLFEDATDSSERPLSHGTLAPGRYVRLSVQDSGVGMDEATLSHIFEPFFTTKEIGQGTGLGLSLVYAIVTDSGGAIDVTSALKRGSTFVIYLAAHEFHLEQDYTKRIFAALEGKMAGPPTFTRLSAL
jgi:signal transduction histidine kinase